MQRADVTSGKSLLLKKFLFVDLREREICCSMDAFIGCFLCVPWPESVPATLAHRDSALTHCTTWPGHDQSLLLH